MRSLPVSVTEEDIEDIFSAADTNKDGRIGFEGGKWIEKLQLINLFFYSGVLCHDPT